MVYLTLFSNSTGTRFTLSPVTEPKRNANGYYNVKKTTAALPIGSQVLDSKGTFKTFGAIDKFISKVDDNYVVSSTGSSSGTSMQATYNTRYKEYSKSSKDPSNAYPIVINYDYSVIHKNSIGTPAFGYNEIKDIKAAVNKLDVDSVVRWLQIDTYGNIGYREHNRGNWSVTVKSVYIAKTSKTGKTIAIANLEKKATNNTKSLLGPEDYYDWNVFESMVGKHFNYKTGNEVSTSSTYVAGVKWYRSSTVYTIELTSSYTKLVDKNNWELGSIWTGNNIDNNYCFYSNRTDFNIYVKYLHLANGMPIVTDKHRTDGTVHDCTKHGGQTHTDKEYYGTTSSSTVNDRLTYDPYKTTFSGSGGSTANPVGKLEFGTRGSYKDGVATVPYLILTLAGDKDFKSKIEMTIHEKDRNTFVSLIHERNLGDSYNTFQLQLFDKDAKQVEAKLLLGFRYIEFYYTDNVSTSKRFRGEVLDYKTVIAGKGLMLTLTGYTSNVQVYTGKESIPWSKIIEARSFSFYYWLNNAGEYHGEVRLTVADKYVGKNDSPKSPKTNVNVLNSTEGLLISPDYVDELPIDINNNSMYCLKASFQTGESKKDTEVLWTSFERMYDSSLTAEQYIEYRPKPKIWSLNDYLKQRNTTFGNELSGLNMSLGDITEPRPSNIVILICVLNGWPFRYKDIKKTRKVSTIPDMVSMSFTEYIKEELIPISMSENAGGSAQFYFWFDDDGYAHFGPQDETASCSLYFNSKEVADSYPLIAFTAAANGSVLMQVDATKSMASVNVKTGDPIDVSAIELEEGDEYLQNYHKSEEWYSTNSLTQNNSNKLITYSNVTVSKSEEDLLKQLRYRYGYVSQYSFKASLDVYGCSDITPGQMVDIYIYVGDGVRSSDPVSKVNDNSKQKGVDEYIGNTTIHHSSGRYFVNKITDTISGGRYLSTLEVLKVNEGQLKLMVGDVESLESYEVKKSEKDKDEESQLDGTGSSVNNYENDPFESYSQFKNLMGGR